MEARFRQGYERLRASYWFLPSMLVAAAIALAALVIELDVRFGGDLVGSYGWLRIGDAQAARSLLSTIAASTISVVSLVFSITIVALTLTASQLGPGLLYTFLTDRGNQAVLGTFLATFVYCLLVLKAVSPDFVPQVSASLALGLALTNVGALVYFIHHITVAIQAANVIVRVAQELDSAIERFLPSPEVHERPGTSPAELDALLRSRPAVLTLRAPEDGYVEAVDVEELLDCAAEHDLLVQLRLRPGRFVMRGQPVAIVRSAHPLDEDAARAATSRVLGTVLIGPRRTPVQDLEFAINQLVEIALRALSPGINDPGTAIQCVDRLGAALSRVASRADLPTVRHDGEGVGRVLLDATDFDGIVTASFDQIRQHSTGDVAVQARLLETIATLAPFCPQEARRGVLLRQAQQVMTAASRHVDDASDRGDIHERFEAAVSALEADALPRRP